MKENKNDLHKKNSPLIILDVNNIFMKKYLFVCLLFIYTFSFSQEIKLIKKDFNKDGFEDTIEHYYSGGSGFGGTYLTLKNGKTGREFELDDFSFFGEIVTTFPVPSELFESSNSSFFSEVKSILFPVFYKNPEASLSWILSGRDVRKEINQDKFFDLIIQNSVIWQRGIPKLPETYALQTSAELFRKFYKTTTEIPKWYDEKTGNGVIVYSGHNHGKTWRNEITNPKFNILISKHGIVLEDYKNMLHSWVFVAEYNLTGGPDKLRWESIGRVEIVDDLIVFSLNQTPVTYARTFIIDSSKGSVARIKDNANGSNDFEIKGKQLIVFGDEMNEVYEIEELKEHLTNLNR